MKIDFTQEVPAPKATLDRLNEIVNRHVLALEGDDIAFPSADDEVELLGTLMGLGRQVEFNIRAAWEAYAVAEALEDPKPRRYNIVLKLVERNFLGEPFHYLMRQAQIITDGLVHGDFYQAFTMARGAYDRQDLGLTQDRFRHQTVVAVTLTQAGLTVDARTGEARTAAGDPVPHRAYVPQKGESFENNFEAFYVSETFVFVYDILLTAFERAYHFRKCIAAAIPSA